MLRTTLSFLVLVPALALSIAACGDKTSTEAASAEAKQSMPFGGPKFIGTFRNDARRIGDLTLLVLKTDGTYHHETLVACFKEPCDPVQQDGTYMFRTEARQTLLEFRQPRSESVQQYAYSLNDTGISLRNLARPGDGFSMLRSPAAWCAGSADCATQNLQTGPCAGQYICERNLCNYQCGAGPEIARTLPKPGSGG